MKASRKLAAVACAAAFILLAAACQFPSPDIAGSGTQTCPLTAAAASCWQSHTGAPYTETQVYTNTIPTNLTKPGLETGDINITVNGTTINNEVILGCVSVHANDVVLSNDIIIAGDADTCNGGDNQASASAVNAGVSGVTDLQLTNVEIDGLNGNGDEDYGLSGSGWSCSHCLIHGFIHDISMINGDVLQDSDLPLMTTQNTGSHAENVFADSGDNDIINHSYIVAARGGNATTAAVTEGSDYGSPFNFTLENSYTEGVAGTDFQAGWCGQTGFVVTGNVFSTDAKDFVENWKPGATNSWSGNVDSTGAAVAEPPNQTTC